VLVLGLAAALLAGCASPPRGGVRVVDRNSHGQVMGGDYIVQRGDTLSIIANRFSLDWRELARQNRIGAPYVIYPGQRLSLGSAWAALRRPRSRVARRLRPSSRRGVKRLPASSQRQFQRRHR